MPNTQIQFFKSTDGNISLEVPVQNESVWLNESQLATLFDRDRTVLNRHIRNIFKEEELDEKSNVQNMHTPNSDKPVKFYNLDVIISIGYRVKSKKGILFRQWANKVLKQYLIEGYVLNETKVSKIGIDHLQNAIKLLSSTLKNNNLLSDESAYPILEIIQQYAKTWDVLLKYDESRLEMPQHLNHSPTFFPLDEVHKSIKAFKSELLSINQATEIFGKEKDRQLESIVACLDQTFDGVPLYGTIEEKAANLLYLVIKDHPFLDGNKRIGSFLFTAYLTKSDQKPLPPQSLVALTLLVAESNPSQKDLMIQLIINLMIKF
jgi:prophage maintenance system killer protein